MALSKIPSAGFQDNVKFRNLIINGDMSQSSRGTSKTTAGSGYHTVDRWRLSKSLTADFDMAQSTDVPSGQGFAKSLKLDCTTANASPSASNVFYLEQRFEGQNLQYLKFGTSNAEQLTLSFWVKSNKTGTWIAELVDSDNALQVSQSYTINSADTWEKKILTYPANTSNSFDNDNARSLTVFFWLVSGSDYTSGTLQTTWGNTATGRAVGQVNHADSTSNNFYITGIQLEAGTTASDFETLPTGVNLMRCQRYYQKSYDIASSPGTVTNNGALWTNIIRNASNQNYWDVRCYQTMRSSPTVSTYSTTSGVSGNFRNVTDSTTNASAVSNTSEAGFSIRPNSGTNQNNGDVIAVHWEADSEL